MLNIDLVYPNEDARSARLRAELRDALHMLDLPPKWQEWEGVLEKPAYLRAVDGPAVFVEGRAVAGADGTAPGRARILVVLQDHLSRR